MNYNIEQVRDSIIDELKNTHGLNLTSESSKLFNALARNQKFNLIDPANTLYHAWVGYVIGKNHLIMIDNYKTIKSVISQHIKPCTR